MPQKTTISNTEKVPLGILTSIASAFEGEASRERSVSKTCEKYYMMSLARCLMPDERVAICHRYIRPNASTVNILKKPNAKRAYYSNLMVCGSVRHCPVCSARITEVRRQELTDALKAANYTVCLLTYTLSHNRKDALKTVLDALLTAYRKLKSRRDWRDMVAEYGWVGSVRSLEVTHGDNGWHVHIHELVLLPPNMPKSALNGLLNAVKGKWGNALRAVGFNTSWEHGVRLSDDTKKINLYVAKFGEEEIVTGWTVEHELTKAPNKRSKKGGRTPNQLLWDYGKGDRLAGQLWQEYARVFKGRNQLVWSRGLRKLLGIGTELTDAEIADSVPADAVLLASLTPDQWRRILALDFRGQVLDAAAQLDADDFTGWLADLLA